MEHNKKIVYLEKDCALFFLIIWCTFALASILIEEKLDHIQNTVNNITNHCK
jgi:hypothetical protein